MRKFKIKNKPKRKYARKAAANLDFSASKTALLGMLPFVFFALIVFTTLILSNHALSQPTKLDLSFTAPTISFAPFTKPIAQMLTTLLQSISTITVPVLPKITVQIPSIDFQTPFTTITTITTKTLATLYHSITVAAIFCYKTIAGFLPLLDPRPIVPLLFHTISSIFSVMITYISFIARTISDLYLFQLTITGMILHAITQLSIGIVSLTYTGILLLSTFIQEVITDTIYAIISFIDSTIKTTTTLLHSFTRITVATLISIWQTITSTTQAILTIIETPFRIMGLYYKKAEPSIMYFFSLIKHAADEFATTAATIFQLPSEVAKQTPK